MAVVRKKQDDKNLKILRELVSLSGNKQCFDCNQKGPTYVNMTIGSFVCTRCSGVLRGLTPPHRVKSISMATFTAEEIDFIKAHGNELCAKTWLGLWDPKRVHTQDHRELMIDKYERKRYYLEPASPLKSITNATQSAPAQKPAQFNGAAPLTNGSTKSIDENNHNNLWPPNGPSNASSGSRWKLDLLPLNDNSNLFSSGAPANGTSLNNSSKNNGINLRSSDNGLSNGFHATTTANKQQNVITKNSLDLSTAVSNVENNNLFTPDVDFVADFGSASIFNAMNGKPSNGTNGTPLTNKSNGLNGVTNGTHTNGIDKLSYGNQTNGFQNGSNNNVNENFADFEHNTIYNAAGLPMSLSSTSNSLKSSGTFNSNSSINSTPSVDRYAALKDLDEQLREMKEKENTQVATTPANPFNGQSAAVQANPFQSPAPSMLWPNEQTALSNGMNGVNGAQSIYPITNGNGIATNAMFPASPLAINGNSFNGNAQYQKMAGNNTFNGTMSNGFPQRNPFAAPVLNATTNPFL